MNKILMWVVVILVIVGVGASIGVWMDKGGKIEPIIPPIANSDCNSDLDCQEKYNDKWVCSEGRCGCTVSLEENPVCGVDGKTYSNEGAAECEGVAVNYYGKCVNNNGEDNCVKCGNECVDLYLPGGRASLGVCDPTTEEFECSYINGNCVKSTSDGSSCGDGKCVVSPCEALDCDERISCPQDCGTTDSVCGDGVCDENEVDYPSFAPHLIYCPQDCETDENIEGQTCKSNAQCTGSGQWGPLSCWFKCPGGASAGIKGSSENPGICRSCPPHVP